MKEIYEFKNMINQLGQIADCPNFPDAMRNNASALQCHIKKHAKLIVKKSGQTWVARYEGVDYLCTDPTWNQASADILHQSHLRNNDDWVYMESLKITDEIAKLRPAVMVNNEEEVLYGVGCNTVYITGNGVYMISEKKVRLATVEDLE